MTALTPAQAAGAAAAQRDRDRIWCGTMEGGEDAEAVGEGGWEAGAGGAQGGGPREGNEDDPLEIIDLAPGGEDLSWECSACTTRNDPLGLGSSVCHVCGTLRTLG